MWDSRSSWLPGCCPQLGLQSLRTYWVDTQSLDGGELERNGHRVLGYPTSTKVSENLDTRSPSCRSLPVGHPIAWFRFLTGGLPLAEVTALMFLVYRFACDEFSFSLPKNVSFIPLLKTLSRDMDFCGSLLFKHFKAILLSQSTHCF